MNVYIRNIIIVLIVNAIVFLIGWGCIVPDKLIDKTHMFGIIGDVEIIRGNTGVVFGICAVLSMLIMIASLVEAIIEDYRPRFCSSMRNEKPRKAPKPQVSEMRITDPKSETTDGDPVVPKMD